MYYKKIILFIINFCIFTFVISASLNKATAQTESELNQNPKTTQANKKLHKSLIKSAKCEYYKKKKLEDNIKSINKNINTAFKHIKKRIGEGKKSHVPKQIITYITSNYSKKITKNKSCENSKSSSEKQGNLSQQLETLKQKQLESRLSVTLYTNIVKSLKNRKVPSATKNFETAEQKLKKAKAKFDKIYQEFYALLPDKIKDGIKGKDFTKIQTIIFNKSEYKTAKTNLKLAKEDFELKQTKFNTIIKTYQQNQQLLTQHTKNLQESDKQIKQLQKKICIPLPVKWLGCAKDKNLNDLCNKPSACSNNQLKQIKKTIRCGGPRGKNRNKKCSTKLFTNSCLKSVKALPQLLKNLTKAQKELEQFNVKSQQDAKLKTIPCAECDDIKTRGADSSYLSILDVITYINCDPKSKKSSGNFKFNFKFSF